MPRASRQKRATHRRDPPAPKTPANPQASLLGIPTELRIEIYEYVLANTLLHLKLSDKGGEQKFIWRACQAPDPCSPMLCEQPVYSATCGPKDRCGGNPKYPQTVPMLATCRTFCTEMKNMVRTKAAISLSHWQLDLFLNATPQHQLDRLHRITLTGAHLMRTHVSHVHSLKRRPINSFIVLLTRLPHLEQMAFQGKLQTELMDEHEKLLSETNGHPFGKDNERSQYWEFFKSECWHLFGFSFFRSRPTLTVVFDGQALSNNHHRGLNEGPGEISRLTATREGKKDTDDTDTVPKFDWEAGDMEISWEKTKILTRARRDVWHNLATTDLYEWKDDEDEA